SRFPICAQRSLSQHPRTSAYGFGVRARGGRECLLRPRTSSGWLVCACSLISGSEGTMQNDKKSKKVCISGKEPPAANNSAGDDRLTTQGVVMSQPIPLKKYCRAPRPLPLGLEWPSWSLPAAVRTVVPSWSSRGAGARNCVGSVSSAAGRYAGGHCIGLLRGAFRPEVSDGVKRKSPRRGPSLM